MKKRNALLLAAAILVCGLGAPWTGYAAQEEDFPTDANPQTYIANHETANNGHVSIALGAKRDLSGMIQYKVEDEDAADRWYLVGSVTWSSSNEAVATVDSGGVITGVRGGAAKITATFRDNTGGKRAQSIGVTVLALEQASGVENSITASEGKWIDLSALFYPEGGQETVAWSSSNENVATVDGGMVRTRSVGRATVTATQTLSDGTVVTHKVRFHVTTIELVDKAKESVLVLAKGQTVNLTDLLYPSYQGNYVFHDYLFAAGNTEVLSVSGSEVTAVAPGSGKVTVSDGYRDTVLHKITITVTG